METPKAGELSPPAALLYANQQAEGPTPLLGDWEREVTDWSAVAGRRYYRA